MWEYTENLIFEDWVALVLYTIGIPLSIYIMSQLGGKGLITLIVIPIIVAPFVGILAVILFLFIFAFGITKAIWDVFWNRTE